MSAIENIIVLVIVAGIIYWLMLNCGQPNYLANCKRMLSDRFYSQGNNSGVGDPYMLMKDSANCGDAGLSNYYYDKYKGDQYYQPHSYDAKNYYALQDDKGTVTLEKSWNNKMQNSMDKAYTDNNGNMYGKVNGNGLTTNSEVNNKMSFNQIDKSNMHPAMANMNGNSSMIKSNNAAMQNANASKKIAQENMTNKSCGNNDQLNVNDLLPDPCLKSKGNWTDVFSECENLVGGQNFVHFEDEHFVNQVLDTRCTKYMSLDLRRPPAVQYADVSIFAKPSVCKNVYDYIRPSLDD